MKSFFLKLMSLAIMLFFAGCGDNASASGQDNECQGELKAMRFKTADGVQLKMYVNFPPDFEKRKNCPAIVFFYGGGWETRSVNQFLPQAEYYASKGFVCFRPEYRVKNIDGTTPFQALEDAKSAMRFVRMNADEFHLDYNRIAAGGGSAGGHLAACCAFVSGYNAVEDNLEISTVPDALILFNPVVDNGPGGYGYNIIGEEYKSFSPLHNVHEPVPPTIFQLGDSDRLVPVDTAGKYKKACEDCGGRCDVIVYEGAAHGFFNKKEYFDKTIKCCDDFLKSIGWLK